MTPKLTRRTRWWIGRHNRRHSTAARAGVVIRKQVHLDSLSGSLDQDAIVAATVTATAVCVCGATRPAYTGTSFGFDGARAVA